MRRRTRAPSAALMAALCLLGCADTPDTGLVPNDPDVGADASAPDVLEYERDPLTSDRDLDGWLDVVEVAIGTDPDVFDAPCAQASQEVEAEFEVLNTRLDLVVIVDTSGSMYQELPDVRDGLLAAIRRAEFSGDARIIVVADTNLWCTGAECTIPTSTALRYVQRVVHSVDTFSVFVQSLDAPDSSGVYPDGWLPTIRENTRVAVLNITDDRSWLDWRSFERMLRSAAPGTFYPGGRRNYVWHSVTGAVLDEGTRPAQPLSEARCPSAAAPGLEYQRLSRITGGLRYSVCNANDYTGLIDTIIDESTRPLGCALELDAGDDAIAPGRIGVQLEQNGVTEQLEDVGEACERRGYYTIGNYVVLCDEVCDGLGSSGKATISAGASCTCGVSPTVGGTCD